MTPWMIASVKTTVLTPDTYSFGRGGRSEETADPLIQTGDPFGRVNWASFVVIFTRSGRIEARIGLRMMPTVGIEIERVPL